MWARSNMAIWFFAAMFFLSAAISPGAESDKASPAKTDGIVVFEDNFESGALGKWTRHGPGVSVITEGGNKLCRIEAGQGALILNLPGDKLSNKRLEVTCRYRLIDCSGGTGREGPGKMFFNWTGNRYSKSRKMYGKASFAPTKSPDQWAQFETVQDTTSGVSELRLRIVLQGMQGALLIDDVRIVVKPQSFIQLAGHKRPKRGKLIFEDNFDGDLSNWVHEGVGTAEVADGRLHVYVTPDHAERRGQNLWLKQKLPANFIVEMRVSPIAPRPEDKVTCNLLWFFSANRIGGKLLETIKQRDGNYGKYISKKGIVPCYTLTWYRLNDPHFVIARRNPGWGELQRNFPPVPTPGKDYTLEIEKRGGEILLVENGTSILLVNDPQPPLGEGYFALRSWHCKASYEYVRIYEIKAESE